MNKEEQSRAGYYYEQLKTEVTEIENNGKKLLLRKICFSVFISVLCCGGILYGIHSKKSNIEDKYNEYIETHDLRCLNDELLAYEEVYEIYEKDQLGNKPYQSLMGGFFYSGDKYLIYPDEKAEKTILHKNNSDVILSDGVVDNINVRDDMIFFRNPSTREIYSYDVSTNKTTSLNITDSGQFIIRENDYFYIDLKKTALMLYNSVNQKLEKIINKDVVSFVVAGNTIIYIDKNHTLYSYDIIDKTSTIIGNNIDNYSFNGILWLQNDKSIYKKNLDKNTMIKVDLERDCDRLLGVTKDTVIYESKKKVYKLNTDKEKELDLDGVFVDISDESILVFDIDECKYKIMR